MSSPLYRLVDGSKQVQRRSFDPSQITQQQIDEAVSMTDLVLNDETLRDILYRFVKDYAEAQHAIEITAVAGSGAFELILTIIGAAVTGGAGVVAAVGSKMHLVRKFNKVSDLLADFAKATERIKNRKKVFNGKNTGLGKLESVDGSVKKTDAHGAETGEVSTPQVRELSSYEDFIESVDDFEEHPELGDKAYELYKEQNWEELEIFFKENNLNKGWPPNRGAIHTKEITLKSGEKIDRDGGYIDDETGKFIDRGTFAAKPDVPFEKRVP
ncbi:hypothetical protein A3746_08795 [Oleibacter sp. HI0075]|nr:hypothetical protein A3746_08795 [Oleibacter sp. HI0075]